MLIDTGIPLQGSLAELERASHAVLFTGDIDEDSGKALQVFKGEDVETGQPYSLRTVVTPYPSVHDGSRVGKWTRFAEFTMREGDRSEPRYHSLWYREDLRLPGGILFELRGINPYGSWSEGMVQKLLGVMAVSR